MSDTQLIKDKLDIVDVIGEYVALKPSGVNHKGLCPFHNEKTPSFMVSRERQSWHCFGCSKGGDVFSFLQESEGMEFIEVLKLLAAKAGVEITEHTHDVQTSQKNRLKEITGEAARFYHNFLTRMDASRLAREYLSGRGLSNDTIESWRIGFVPDQWDLLTGYLIKKGYGIDDLVASGLTIKKDGHSAVSGRGFYDRFRGRIMFPIHDVHGGIVGFTGRVLKETEYSGGKYVNTPQTLLYDKSRVVFGLYAAKQEIKKKDQVVVVEGQMDVITSHQAGVTNVVATSGTAMTEEQVLLLKRYTANMTIAFDADIAGQKAAKRGIDVAIAAGMNVRVIRIADGAGSDPDDCIKKDPSVWKSSIVAAVDIMQWYTDQAFLCRDLHDPKHRQAVANEILPEISRIPYALERDHWLRIVAGRLGVDVSVLREDMGAPKKADAKQQARSGRLHVKEDIPAALTRAEKLFERLVMLMLAFPGECPPMSIDPMDFPVSPYTRLYELIKAEYTAAHGMNIDRLRELSRPSLSTFVDTLLLRVDEEFISAEVGQAREEYHWIVTEMLASTKKSRMQALEGRIAQAEAVGNTEEVMVLLRELNTLMKGE